MTENTGYSLADIGALMNNRNGGWGNESGLWFLFLLIAMMGGGGFGWGRNAYANEGLTRTDMFEGFNNQNVMRKLDGINNGLCDGFYATNTNNLQAQNQLQRDLCQGFSSVNAGISENRFASQQCCCETNRNIDAVRYENAKNTCDIIQASNANTQRIIDMMTQDKIEALRTELQSAQLALQNNAQTQTLINELRPCAVPAYLTCSPYTALNTYGCNSCGC